MRYAAVLTALAAALAPPAAAQVSPPAPPTGTGALRVFPDCTRCDFDFLRQEITFINYVRDRKDAEVHVLGLSLPAGDRSAEEVLLLRRQLATTHRYSLGFGISYQFGSIYNNVVNPRFGGR